MISICKHKEYIGNSAKLFMTAMIGALFMSLTSCEIETSDNGKLDGFWHLERVDTLANGRSADYSEKLIFWGVQLRLIEAKDLGNITTTKSLYFQFKQTSDSLYINKVYENRWHEDNPNEEVGGDIPVVAPNGDTQRYGINDVPEGFLKERLDGSKMVLKSKTLRMTFRRF